MKRVCVSWDDLELALTANADEWSSDLDVRTGEVQRMPVDPMDQHDDWRSPGDLDDAVAAGLLVRIEPLGSRVQCGWMVEFTESVADPQLRARPEGALDGRGAFGRFKRVLDTDLDARQRWFALRDARLRPAAREWLAAHGLAPAPGTAGNRPGLALRARRAARSPRARLR